MTGHADGCHDSGRRNDYAKGLPKRCCCAHLRKVDERRGKLRTFGRWADIAHVINDGRALRHAPACGMFLSMVNGWWCRVMVPGGGAGCWCRVVVPGDGAGWWCPVVVPAGGVRCWCPVVVSDGVGCRCRVVSGAAVGWWCPGSGVRCSALDVRCPAFGVLSLITKMNRSHGPKP